MTGDLAIDLATTGYRWFLNADRTIDWSISSGLSGEFWTNPSATATAIDLALDMVSYYANVTFNYVGSFASPAAAAIGGAELNFTLDGNNVFFSSTNQWARAFFPRTGSDFDAGYVGGAGDVYLNINSPANSLPSYDPGTTGWALLLHELGHALGLKHPHDSGGTGRPTFDQVNLGGLDRDWVSVMSYNDDYSWNLLGYSPASFMVLDVLALQYLYGRNMSTNAGDSLYNLNATNAYLTLWDASGNDTLSFAGASKGFSVELPWLTLSSLVPTRVGAARPMEDINLDAPRTLFWLTGEFENVIGSAFADDIYGNEVANSLLGGGGNDTIDGGDGTNFLRGEDGDDWIIGGADTDDSHGNMGNDTVEGGGGDDWVVGGKDLDKLFGDAGHDVVLGNIGNDTIDGGAGNDVVRGGKDDDVVLGNGGDDWISGDRNNDTLTGGAGADNFHVFDGSGVDRVTDFSVAQGDRVWLLAGTQWSAAQVGADTVVTVTGAEGGQLVLVGVQMSSLPAGWIFGG